MLDNIVEKHGITQINGAFQDIDAYKEAVHDWELDISQLSKGRHHTTLFNTTLRDTSFLAFSHSIHSEHFAHATNPGLSIFLLDHTEKGTFSLFGKEASYDHIAINPQHTDLYTVTPHNTHAFTFSLDYDRLDRVARNCLDGKKELVVPKEAIVCKTNPLVTNALRRSLRQLETLLRAIEYEEQIFFIDDFIDQHIVTLIIQILIGDTLGSQEIPLREGRVHRILEIINNNLDSPPSISELAADLNITPRTLQYIFRQTLGITPKSYITAKRLEATRRKITTAPYGKGVITDAANHMGFWHMGKFSKDFKDQFGYLPTDCLRKP